MSKAFYICEYCQCDYDTEEEANDCEKSHATIDEISNLFFNPQSTFPYKFDVKLTNGTTYTYHIIPSRLTEDITND